MFFRGVGVVMGFEEISEFNQVPQILFEISIYGWMLRSVNRRINK